MTSSPKKIEERIQRMTNAWRGLAPDKSFSGKTLTQFEAVTAPSLEARRRIEDLENQLALAIAERDSADATFEEKARQVVAGVLADPDFGDDSALYEAFGYTRRSTRKSGLHRTRHDKPSTT